MAAAAKTMTALIQSHEGYADKPSDMALDSLAPYVELAEIPVPEPKNGQALIKVALASVNPSDVAFIKGVYGQPRRKGVPAGFEGVGEVVDARGGLMARRLKGRRVSFATGVNGSGSWAQYAVADASTCIPLMKGVRDEDGAGMIVNPLTAMAMFDIVRGDGAKAFILTAGASQLSKLMASLAHDEGFRAISIVRRESQVARLKEAGAAHVLNTEAPDYEKQLTDVIVAERPRILLDATTGPTASHIFHAMPRGARWVVYGRMDTSVTAIEEPGQLIFMHKRIEGFWLVEFLRKAPIWKKLQVVRAAQKRFASGAWRNDVTATIPIAEAIGRVPAELAKPNGKVFIAPAD